MIKQQRNNSAFVNGGPSRDRKVTNCPIPPSYRGFSTAQPDLMPQNRRTVIPRHPQGPSNIDNPIRRFPRSTGTVVQPPTTSDWRCTHRPAVRRLIRHNLHENGSSDGVDMPSPSISSESSQSSSSKSSSVPEPRKRHRGGQFHFSFDNNSF